MLLLCVQYLEELGVMKQVRRFAGASAGSMVAALLAVGYNSYEIEEFLSDRLDKVFLGNTCSPFLVVADSTLVFQNRSLFLSLWRIVPLCRPLYVARSNS